MDISISSNFERYLYYLAGEDAATLKGWMDQFESTGRVSVSADLHNIANGDFLSFASNKSQIVKTMTDLYAKEKYLVCPHTATAVVGVNALKLPSETTLILATAHPAKFEEAIELSLSAFNLKVPPRPDTLEALFSMPTKKVLLPNSLPQVQAFMKTKLPCTSRDSSEESKGWGQYLSLPNMLTVAAAGALVAFAVAKMKN